MPGLVLAETVIPQQVSLADPFMAIYKFFLPYRMGPAVVDQRDTKIEEDRFPRLPQYNICGRRYHCEIGPLAGPSAQSAGPPVQMFLRLPSRYSPRHSTTLNRRTVWVERRFNYTNKHGLTRLHARPTSNMFAYFQSLLNAQPVHLFSGLSYPTCADWPQPHNHTNYRIAR